MIARDPSKYVWWLASRSAGIVAFVLVAGAVTLGLFMAAGLVRRPGGKRSLVKLHEQIALAGLVAIVLHGVLLLGDKWLNPGITGIVIPFTMGYRPLWTGLGILGGYLAMALGLSYYLRRRIGTRRWRQLHRATVLVYALGLLHALNSGTDGGSLWFQLLAAMTALPMAGLLAVRYLRPRRRPAATAARAKPGRAGRPGGRAGVGPSHPARPRAHAHERVGRKERDRKTAQEPPSKGLTRTDS